MRYKHVCKIHVVLPKVYFKTGGLYSTTVYLMVLSQVQRIFNTEKCQRKIMTDEFENIRQEAVMNYFYHGTYLQILCKTFKSSIPA
jgi:hypothetical protein